LSSEYDSANRLIKNIVGDAANPALAQVPETFSYSYTPTGNRQSVGCSRCLSAAYVYDGLHRLISVNSQNLVGKQLQYDALSRLTRVTGGGGTQSIFTYDAASQLLTIRNAMLGTELAPFDYAYDPVGHRTSLTDRFGLHQYGYDRLSRLINADHPAASQLLDEVFTYDPVGNRLTSHLSTIHQHNAANRLLEDAQCTYTYDANGNRTTKTAKADGVVTSYHYDIENQLIGLDWPDGRVV